jgi:predicted nucleic acid-binding protein
MKQLLDTTIFIDYFRGRDEAKTYLKNQPQINCSVVTAAELIQGSRNKVEKATHQRFLNKVKIITLTPTIGELMLDLVKRHTLSHGLEIPDVLIAATALEYQLTLVTANTQHFSFIKTLRLLDWNQITPLP